MVLLAFAVVLFAVCHIAPAFPGLKARLQVRLGKAYGPAFGIAALFSVGLVVLGWRLAAFEPVYDPPAYGRHVTFTLVLIGFICLGIFVFRGRLRQILRMPLSLGVIAWGIGHLFANGDLASLILFGGLVGYGVAHLAVGLANGYRPTPEVRSGHDVLSILGGVALYGLVIQLHGVIIGVPVFQLQ